MQGNQFPSSNENINIQLRLSPLILLSEGLEKEANELCGRSDAAAASAFFFFFFRNGVESRRIFFFFSFLEASKGGGKKVIRVLTKGKTEGLSQRLCSSPVPPRGHGTGSIPERAGRCLPAPRGEGRTALSAECLPRPAPRRAAGRSIPPILPGCWQPEPPDTSPEPRTVPEPDAACSPRWGSGLPITAASAGRGWRARFAPPSWPRMLAERLQLFFSVAPDLRLACWILRFCMRSDYSCICI